MELRQHRSVDFVGLDLRPGNGSNQDRIGDDDPTDEGREQTDNHIRIAGRLDDDLVIGLERLGELQQATVFEIYPSRIPDFTIFQNGHLSESQMDVESNESLTSMKPVSAYRAYTCQIIILSSRIIGASSVWSDLGSASAGSEPPEEHWAASQRRQRPGRGRLPRSADARR